MRPSSSNSLILAAIWAICWGEWVLALRSRASMLSGTGCYRNTASCRGKTAPAARAWLVSGLPLKYATFYIRLARAEQAAALSDLCFRSKVVWGYDPEFMALMPAALEVVPEHIAAGDVWIATGFDGEIAGVVALAPGDAPDTLNLNKLFVRAAPLSAAASAGRYSRTPSRRRCSATPSG